MSVFDDRLIEIAAQRRLEAERKHGAVLFDESGNEIEAGSNGYGNLMGVVMIFIGAVLLIYLTYGLAILFFVGAIFAFGGERVTDTALRDMHQNAVQRSTEGVNGSFFRGLAILLLYVVVGVLVIAAVMVVALGGGR